MARGGANATFAPPPNPWPQPRSPKKPRRTPSRRCGRAWRGRGRRQRNCAIYVNEKGFDHFRDALVDVLISAGQHRSREPITSFADIEEYIENSEDKERIRELSKDVKSDWKREAVEAAYGLKKESYTGYLACADAARLLQRLLGKDFITVFLYEVQGISHYFCKTRNGLIVDPTWKQLFAKKVDLNVLGGEPNVFVGKLGELTGVVGRLLKQGGKEPTPQDLGRIMEYWTMATPQPQ